MATLAQIAEKVGKLETRLDGHEALNVASLKAHEDMNAAALAAVHVRIDTMETKVDSFGPVLEGINTSLGILASDKTKRDTLAEAEAKKKPKTPWDVFKAKMVDALATLVAGGMVAGVVWVAIQVLRGS